MSSTQSSTRIRCRHLAWVGTLLVAFATVTPSAIASTHPIQPARGTPAGWATQQVQVLGGRPLGRAALELERGEGAAALSSGSRGASLRHIGVVLWDEANPPGGGRRTNFSSNARGAGNSQSNATSSWGQP